MLFNIISKVASAETIAAGNIIREIKRLRKVYGFGRWKKKKGIATIKLINGEICRAEIHWYEAHSLGKFEYKLKRILD